MKKSQVSLFILIFLLVTGFLSCSIRDYSNNLLDQQFQGPIITVFSPTNNGTIYGSASVIGNASDVSGVSRVLIISGNQTNQISNPSLSTYLSFNVDVALFTMGMQDIVILAYDKFGIMSKVIVKVNVVVVSPYLFVHKPQQFQSFTNIVSMIFSGTSSISVGSIIGISALRINDNQSFSVSGINNWNCGVSLLNNRTNTIRITATSDMGISTSRDFQVIQDGIAPILTFTTPTNNQAVPRDLNVEISAQDSLSPIIGTICRLDSGIYYTNNGPFASGWYPGLTNGPHQLFAQARDMAGNDSLLTSITVYVDDKIPSIMIYNPWYFTNVNSFSVYGQAIVGNAYQITNISISVNGGSYNPVSFFNNSSNTVWTNNITVLVANQDNTVTIKAVSSAGKINYYTRHFFVDTIPPDFNQLSPVNGSIIRNSASFNYIMDLQDSGSGLGAYIQKVAIGGITNYTRTNQFVNMPHNFYQAGVSENLPTGAVVTNIITLFDGAFNKTTQTNIIKVYPFVCASPSGSDINGGFFHQPMQNIQLAVQWAQSIGVTNVVLMEGNYSLGNGLNNLPDKGVNITGNNVNIMGGVNAGTGLQTGISILDGASTLSHVISIKNAGNIRLDHLMIMGGTAFNAGDRFGAGIIMSNVNGILLTNLVLNGNTATGTGSMGGGIFAYNADNMRIDIIAQNNSAEKGGGIYVQGDQNIFRIQLNNNGATLYGGGIYLKGNNNTVKGQIYRNTASQGGGLYLDTLSTAVIESIISSNQAYQGGGVYIMGGSTINISSLSTLGWNVATNSGLGKGGGVYLNGGNNHQMNAILKNNLGDQGGAVYNLGGTTGIFNGTCRLNTAFQQGGALVLEGGSGHRINAQIYSNQAPQGGGVVIKNGLNSLLSSSSQIYFNQATGLGISGNGGGILITNSDSISVFSSIHDNRANWGGGIAFIDSLNILQNSTIKANTAKNWGGGIFTSGLFQSTIQGSITTNISTNDGGGVYISASTNLTIGALINKNTSFNGDGGGICIASSSYNLLITNTISSNTANGDGGGMLIDSSYWIDVSAMLKQNFALQLGGGIAMISASNVNISSRIINNTANNQAGAIYLEQVDAINIQNSLITNNTASTLGSIIHFGPMSATLSNININNNTIGGKIPASDIAIYEPSSDLKGHSIQNNIFLTNKLWKLYYDLLPVASYIDITQVSLLNVSTNQHDASMFGGNIVQ